MSRSSDASRRRVVRAVRQNRYLCSMRAQDEGGRGNTSMTLVGSTVLRNRNELASIFIPICPPWGVLRHVSTLGSDTAVTLVIRSTRLTATGPRFGGIVIAGLGKTAREGGKRMALMGHAEEQCRHVTWGATERSLGQRRR